MDLYLAHGVIDVEEGEALEGDLLGHVEVDGFVIVDQVDFAWVMEVVP